MKRLLATVSLALVAGVLATACNALPTAATVNGTTVSVASLNTQLQAFDTTQAGQCLLEAETGQTVQTQGAGGAGTFNMAFADSILQNRIGDALAAQLAASKGLTVTASDLANAGNTFEATLDGEISATANQAAQSGTASYCVSAAGQALTGAQVVSGLPTAVRDQLIANNAVDQQLLADGAVITSGQMQAYYAANKALFTADCVSVIVTDTQAHAQEYLAQIKGGASFATVAKASSLDTQTAPSGGALGCSNTESQVEQALGLTSVAVGAPIGPLQDPSTGAWELFEVTSQTVEPLSAAAGVIHQELLQSTANGNRVAKEIVVFARRSTVSVDPRYGTWQGHVVVAPVAPPERFLLAAAVGHPLVAPTGTAPLGASGSRPVPSAAGSGRGETGPGSSGTGG